MFKFVDHKICGIDLVCSSTAYCQITSIKLLTYKVTVKHFICTQNVIFEFCHNERKQWSNEEPKEMSLRVQLLSFFPLASTWESNTQFFLEWKQVVFPSLDIYIREFLMRVGGGVSSCVWQTQLLIFFQFCFHISNIKGLLFNCLIAKLNWWTIPF